MGGGGSSKSPRTGTQVKVVFLTFPFSFRSLYLSIYMHCTSKHIIHSLPPSALPLITLFPTIPTKPSPPPPSTLQPFRTPKSLYSGTSIRRSFIKIALLTRDCGDPSFCSQCLIWQVCGEREDSDRGRAVVRTKPKGRGHNHLSLSHYVL